MQNINNSHWLLLEIAKAVTHLDPPNKIELELAIDAVEKELFPEGRDKVEHEDNAA